MEIADRLRIGDRTVDVRVLEGRPATEIVVEAGRFRADLIVVGARGLSTVRRLLIGSVSSEVVDHAPCPVLVARRADVQRVMLAIDASPSAAAAADYIAESGLFDEAKILVMSVADPGMPWWSGISPVDGKAAIDVYADAVEAAEHRARKAVDHAVERLQGDPRRRDRGIAGRGRRFEDPGAGRRMASRPARPGREEHGYRASMVGR